MEEVWIPVPDGVRLAADLYMPTGGEPGERFPVLLEYLPYRKTESRSRNYSLYVYFIRRGYAVARFDIRGTGNSEGVLIPFEYSDQENDDGAAVTPGAVGFVQTAGELHNFHPHVHVLVTDGGSTPDGAFRPLAWFDSRHVERLFRAEVLRRLLDKELISEAVVDNLLSWRHSGFSVHGAVCVQDRESAVRLGRYMIRCPIVLERLAWGEGAFFLIFYVSSIMAQSSTRKRWTLGPTGVPSSLSSFDRESLQRMHALRFSTAAYETNV